MAGYDRAWQRCRALKLKMTPLCEECTREGRKTAGAHVDHIKAIRLGGDRLDLDNLQTLCVTCHNRFKTSEDSHILKWGYSDRVGVDGWPTDPRNPKGK